jgi:hypothetical protein
VWDRNAYFKANYGWSSTQWQTNTGLSPSVAVTAANYASRYNVYKWEMDHRGQTIGGVTILASTPTTATGTTPVNYRQPVCSPLQGYGSGVVPDTANPDRRKISVAVVNCLANSVNGNSRNVPVQDWLDVFLVRPSLDRGSGTTQVSNSGSIYVEVVGDTQTATDAGSVQLVKKSVPYLIQ